jgi:hypothetical protein
LTERVSIVKIFVPGNLQIRRRFSYYILASGGDRGGMATKPIVYIESTVPSFYVEEREEPDMVARRQWTREWWDNHRAFYDLVISEAVLDELERGDYPNKNDALALVEPILLLPIDREIAEIVEAYIWHQVMPRDPVNNFFRCPIFIGIKCPLFNGFSENSLEKCRRIWYKILSHGRIWGSYGQNSKESHGFLLRRMEEAARIV